MSGMLKSHGRGVVLALVAVLLIPVSSTAAETSVGTDPQNHAPRTGIGPVYITLHGSASRGWGLSNATMSQTGPALRVHFLDTLNLTLISNDTQDHNWFIDYDNNLVPSGNEPSSRDFGGSGSLVVVQNFLLDRPGSWTYMCRFHQTTMKGTILVLPNPRPVNLTLFGNTARGWGFSNATTTNPGPPLVVLWGTRVNLTLISNDTQDHNWFIDYDNSLSPNGNEPSSPIFGGTPRTIIVFGFDANQRGNWTYLCRFHQTTMRGNITIEGGPPPMHGPGLGVSLFTGMMLGTLGIVLVVAAVYHVRSVRAARRTK